MATAVYVGGETTHPLDIVLPGDPTTLSGFYELLIEQNIPALVYGIQVGFRYGQECEYKRALRCIWKHKPEGWWKLKDEFLRNRICSEAEFDFSVSEEIERRR